MTNPTDSTLDLRGAKTPAALAQERHAIDLRVQKEERAELTLPTSTKNVQSWTASLRPARLRERFGGQAKTTYTDLPVDGLKKVALTPHLLRVTCMVLVVASAYHYLPYVASSLAYFTDTEGAPANVLAAGLLDIQADGGGAETLACGDTTTFSVQTTLTTSRPANYSVGVENAYGNMALCERLAVDAKLDDVRQYPNGGSDALLGLYVPSVTTSGLWTFDVSLPLGAQDIPDGAYCSVDIVFQAWCPLTGSYGDGFSDEDRVTIQVTKEGCNGPDCEPCGTGGCGDVTVVVENNNSATVVNNISSSANTGGNSASGGGTVVTGDSTSVVNVVNTVNTNVTTITNSNCCSACGCTTAVGCVEGSACTGEEEAHRAEGASSTQTGDAAAALQAEIQARMDEARARLEGLTGRGR